MMDPQKEIYYSFIEEDDTEKAYFRLIPLLSPNGLVKEEAIAAWPDDGALRIVPDKNEQVYFKDRMRELGGFCLFDISAFPAEANKIRTNKNYKQGGKERNQFILFSDAVKPLPENTFFEIVHADPTAFEDAAKTASTPLFYIEHDATLYGPVAKAAPSAPDPSGPMEAVLYQVTCPDASVKTILCSSANMKQETDDKAAAPAEPASKPDAEKNSHEKQELKAHPAKKTDKEHTKPEAPAKTEKEHPTVKNEKDLPSEKNKPQPEKCETPAYEPKPKNKLQEYVAQQLKIIKNEPPAVSLPKDAKLVDIPNPYDAAATSFETAWAYPDLRQKLLDCLYALPGFQDCICQRSIQSGQMLSPVAQTLQKQIHDLEAKKMELEFQIRQSQGKNK